MLAGSSPTAGLDQPRAEARAALPSVPGGWPSWPPPAARARQVTAPQDPGEQHQGTVTLHPPCEESKALGRLQVSDTGTPGVHPSPQVEAAALVPPPPRAPLGKNGVTLAKLSPS